MPPKHESFIESLKHDRVKNIKLPSITPQNLKIDKQLIKPKLILKSNRDSENETKLLYAKPNPSEQAISALRSRSKRTVTEHMPNDFKKLTKLEQNIMMQIQNLDVCLESQRNELKEKNKQKTSMFGGNIFLNEINQFVIEKFHECLSLQSEASYSINDGFEVQKYFTDSNGEVKVVDGKIVKNVPSINNKLLSKSIKTIQRYDEQKSNEYVINHGKEWSLNKRYLPELNLNQQNELEKELIHKNYSIKSNNNSFITFSMINSKLSPIKLTSQSVKKNNDSKSTNLFESKVSALTKNSKISLLENLPTFNNKYKKSTTIKTEPTEISSHNESENIVLKLSKKEVKFMLEKCKNIVSVWMPPSSYPQFFGIFTYKLLKSQKLNQPPFPNPSHRCRLIKYFFNKFGLNKKFFNSILEYLCFENNLLIESLEMTIEKSVFDKIFSKIGWVIKSWDSATKIRASFFREIKEKD